MSTIKVDTIATRTGSGNITASNTIAGTSATLSGTLGVTGDLTVDTSTLKVDSSNNRVGVGLTAPEQPLHVRSSTFAYIRSESTNATLTGFDMGQHQDGSGHLNLRDNHPIKISTNDTLRLRIDADGLKFGNDTAAANALDDYEEGTFTVSPWGGGTINSSVCRYVKIGKFVSFVARVIYNTTNNGDASGFSGLPFTAGSTDSARGGHVSYSTYGSGHYALVANSSTRVIFYNLSGATLLNSHFSAKQVYVSGHYYTD